jgi:hypothetical protein
MLIHVLNIKLTCEWHEAIKFSYKKAGTRVIVALGLWFQYRDYAMFKTLVCPPTPQLVADVFLNLEQTLYWEC